MVDRHLNADLGDEQWRVVVENHDYEVSNHGNVRRATEGRNTAIGRPLKLQKNVHGYFYVTLCEPGLVRKVRMVHRLVAMAFIKPVSGRPFVNHRNFIITDNHVDNLEWCTQAENLRHAREAGRWPAFDRRGSANGHSKLSESDVRQMRMMREKWIDLETIAGRFGISKYQVWSIVTRRSWKHIDD